MTKAYIVHYVGYDYNDRDSGAVAYGMIYELPQRGCNQRVRANDCRRTPKLGFEQCRNGT